MGSASHEKGRHQLPFTYRTTVNTSKIFTVEQASYLRFFLFFLLLLMGRLSTAALRGCCAVVAASAEPAVEAGATTPVAPMVIRSRARASRSCLIVTSRSASIFPSLGWLFFPPA